MFNHNAESPPEPYAIMLAIIAAPHRYSANVHGLVGFEHNVSLRLFYIYGYTYLYGYKVAT